MKARTTTAARASTAMSDAEVHAAVEAEALTLVPSANTSGFKGVTSSAGGSSRFQANCAAAGSSRRHCLGHFGTALQAALASARFLGPDDSAAAAAAVTPVAKPLGMSEPEVLAAAEAEGLTLVQCSDHGSGFQGVSKVYGGRFQAGVRLKGQRHYLGTFGTRIEAVMLESAL